MNQPGTKKQVSDHFYRTRKYKPGVTVVLMENETFESLIRRFKRKITKSGIMNELKDKMFHETKGQKIRRKKKIAKLRRLQEESETNVNRKEDK